jgi:cyanophycinase
MTPQGTVLLAGGGATLPETVRAFIRFAGGLDARIVILAHTQSDIREAGERSVSFFEQQGARNVVAPDSVQEETLASYIHTASGVWIPGGDQNRLMRLLVHSSAFRQAMQGVLRRGGVVGGTSAGASLMGTWMPTGERNASDAVRRGATSLARGIDLLPNSIVDQHFIRRNRWARLLCAVLEHPDCVGIGLDEGAWAVVQANELRVYQGQVVVLRAATAPREKGRLMGCRDLRMSLLLEGDTLLLGERRG